MLQIAFPTYTTIIPAKGDTAPIQSLPEEMLIDIFSFMKLGDKPSISLVCKHFKHIAEDGLLYKIWLKQRLTLDKSPNFPSLAGDFSYCDYLKQAKALDGFAFKEVKTLKLELPSFSFYREIFGFGNWILLGCSPMKLLEIHDPKAR